MVHGIARCAGASLLIVLISLSGAFACTLPDMRTNERPDPDGKPTQVSVSIIVADLLGVDDVNQQLDIDLIATFSWNDPRLSGLAGCRFNVTEVWVPPISLFNSSNLRLERRNARAQVSVGESGNARFRNRFTGLISSYHNLHEFPFDRHAFKITFGSIRDSVEELEFVADHENTWISDRLNIAGWSVSGVQISAATDALPKSGQPVSVLTLTINAKRDTGYYVYRVIFPLALVVAMSWAIFWVPPSRFEFQIGLGATSMLTAIAFNLMIADALPRLGYLTILDMIMIMAITMVFLAIVEALVAGLFVLRGNEPAALRLDRISRILFPTLLLCGWMIIIFRW